MRNPQSEELSQHQRRPGPARRPTPPKTPTPVEPNELPALVFSPMAWLKLNFFLHCGDTEVGGFGVGSAEDPLYVQDFVTVTQKVTCATVEFDDAAVADYFDRMVDEGHEPGRFARIWLHTHPGTSPQPSVIDEATFERVFGRCDWSVMFVVARSGKTYARLRFSAGPRAEILLPVRVDWRAWGRAVMEHGERMGELVEAWMDEYGNNVRYAEHRMEVDPMPGAPRATLSSAGLRDGPALAAWREDWRDFSEDPLAAADDSMPIEALELLEWQGSRKGVHT